MTQPGANENANVPLTAEGADVKEEDVIPPSSMAARFFERSDWLSFATTFAAMLGIYLSTLMPDVGLGNDGVFATAAMYAGVPNPAGFPLWTMYAWLFTELIPFHNIAWRVSVSSATAGALACGLIALMVSHGGALMLEGLHDFRRLAVKEEKWLRLLAGYAAGMAFGLDELFWRRALTPDPWPLTVLLFALMTCLLMRWMATPLSNRYLYAALFVYGLGITNSQTFLIAVIGVELVMVLAQPKLGRDVCAVSTLFVAAVIRPQWFGLAYFNLGNYGVLEGLAPIQLTLGISTALASVILIWKYRALFTEWRKVIGCGVSFLLGLSAVFFAPIASMANPPMNWGYPRTVEGFFHVISRGQYEKAFPTGSPGRFFDQTGMYGEIVLSDLGCIYLLAAAIPFLFLLQMRRQARNWMFGLTGLYFCMAFLMLITINPNSDHASRDVNKIFLAASHLILTIWAGYGLIIIGTKLGRSRGNFPVEEVRQPL